MRMITPIADLHCDLLYYLEGHSDRTALQPLSRCSVPQLIAGQVKMQTLAIFTQTEPLSVKKGMAQAMLYKSLPLKHPDAFVHLQNPPPAFNNASQKQPVGILMAYENASGFCDEQEPLEQGLKRLRKVIREIARPLYISLTWNGENRFGGGALTTIGLREDGKRLLEELHQQNIAIDLSHTSDALAYDILDYIENKGLALPLIASHSNARRITSVPRNLPDEIAKELFRRQGVVGLNLYRPFIGISEEDILKHVTHWLEMGGEKCLCLGADFFYEHDLPTLYRQGIKEPFFDRLQDASCYPHLLDFLHSQLRLSESILNGLAHQNLLNFWQRSQNQS